MTTKLFISALAAVAAASVALPAAAQSYGGPQGHHNRGPAANSNGWNSINARQANLDRRIDMGIRNGQLNRREAVSLRTQFSGLLRLESQYRRNGLNAWERQDLDRRFDRLAAQIRVERRDRDGRRW